MACLLLKANADRILMDTAKVDSLGANTRQHADEAKKNGPPDDD